MDKDKNMTGKFKCYIHNFNTDIMSEWDIHMSEFIHLTTGYMNVNNKNQNIMFFGRVPRGLSIYDILRKQNE